MLPLNYLWINSVFYCSNSVFYFSISVLYFSISLPVFYFSNNFSILLQYSDRPTSSNSVLLALCVASTLWCDVELEEPALCRGRNCFVPTICHNWSDPFSFHLLCCLWSPRSMSYINFVQTFRSFAVLLLLCIRGLANIMIWKDGKKEMIMESCCIHRVFASILWVFWVTPVSLQSDCPI